MEIKHATEKSVGLKRNYERNFKSILRHMKTEMEHTTFMQVNKSKPRKEVHSNKYLFQQTRKVSNKQANSTTQGSKREQTKS